MMHSAGESGVLDGKLLSGVGLQLPPAAPPSFIPSLLKVVVAVHPRPAVLKTQTC